jgi:signal transduction histidine kinase
VEHEFSTIGRKTFLLSGQQIFDEGVGTNTILIVFQDVSDRESAASKLRALNARLRDEKELAETRLAHELHDLSSQGFAGLSIDLARLASPPALSPEEMAQELRALVARVSELALSTHDLARRLHPSILHDLGLESALKAECDAFKLRTSLALNYQVEAVPRTIPEAIALCLYRVAQELLRNVAAHAQAKRVKVMLSSKRARLLLVIQDDGVGFEPQSAYANRGLGLISLSERVAAVGGTVSVRSKPGMGTTTTVGIPLPDNHKASKPTPTAGK